MLILWRKDHSGRCWSIFVTDGAASALLILKSWIRIPVKPFKGLFLMQSSRFSSIKQYSYQQIHATLWTEAVWLKAHIYRQPGRALFNQEKSKLMQTKGQLSKSACCFFVCTIFDSFLNDFPRWHLSHSHNSPTSNSATQHSDIYRGNSTLTLFELICPSISYREAFGLPDVKFLRLSENRSITGLSRLFSFDSWHQNYRLDMARGNETTNSYLRHIVLILKWKQRVVRCLFGLGQHRPVSFPVFFPFWHQAWHRSRRIPEGPDRFPAR